MLGTDNSMPEALAKPFEELHQRLCNLYLEWNLFRELFAHDEDRIVILNQTAGTLCGCLQRVLQDWVYLGITRMTDPAKTNKTHENLTLRQLLDVLCPFDPSLHREVEKALNKAEIVCLPFREHRDKRIAHNDLKRSLAKSYVRPSRQSVEEALGSIAEVMNVFHRHYNGAETGYKHVIFSGGGKALDHHLRAAVFFHKVRRKAMLGEISSDQLMSELLSYPE